jgi:hypothetical protein
MKKAALWYGRQNWRIFPVWPIRDGRCGCGQDNCGQSTGTKAPVGKHPIAYLTGDWRKSATTDPAVIEKWWTAVPDANIATCDYLRIDVDTKHNGRENWQELIMAHDLPDTLQCFTPSGGEHWYFLPPDNWAHSNAVGDLPKGIDVRGHGVGYTLLPPSNHLQGEYEWELSSRPDSIAAAPLPSWLEELLKPTAEKTAVFFSSDSSDKPNIDQLSLSAIIQDTITREPNPDSDRSAIDQSVITALVKAGADDDFIHAVFSHYPIGQKFLERGKNADKYLAHSIGRARSYLEKNKPKPKPTRIEEISPPLTPSQQEQVNEIVARLVKDEYWRGYHDAMTLAQREKWHRLGFTDGIIDSYQLGYASQHIDPSTGEILVDPALTMPIFDLDGSVVNLEYRYDDGRIEYEADVPNIHYIAPDTNPLLLWPDSVTALHSYLHIGSLPYTFAGLPQRPLVPNMVTGATVVLEPKTITSGRRLALLDARFIRLPLSFMDMLERGATADMLAWYIKQARSL